MVSGITWLLYPVFRFCFVLNAFFSWKGAFDCLLLGLVTSLDVSFVFRFLLTLFFP